MHLGDYELRDILAVAWCEDMAARFPNADHRGCRQQMWHDGTRWHAHTPPHCLGYHCVRCGAATGQYGHRNCPNT